MPMQQAQETQVQSLGWEDPLEKEMVTHSSILAWKNPMDREAWQATVHGVVKSQMQLSTCELNWPDTRHVISRSYELNFASPPNFYVEALSVMIF